jgi:hypothetical protein
LITDNNTQRDKGTFTDNVRERDKLNIY